MERPESLNDRKGGKAVNTGKVEMTGIINAPIY
jgi:hypothetical protein